MTDKKQEIINHFIKKNNIDVPEEEIENVIICLTFEEWRDSMIDAYNIHSYLIEYIDFAKMLIENDGVNVFGFRVRNGVDIIYELTDETKTSWFEGAYVVRCF